MSRHSLVVAGTYVVIVAVLAALGWRGAEQDVDPAEVAALVLTLPALVVGLPFVYVIGSSAWNITGADAGGPMWPVTLAYALTFAVIAAGNAALVMWLASSVRRRRAAAALRTR
ncbi:hypothetical protein [Cellulomonas sp. HZM]|uniref:hypothetical protein n=1 Tax=Cellulomonas sp. HZM TaxID=1454010 RepID=UPI00049301CF|nr:hypothetical protein [Cellulomonas sp. HZM]